MRIDRTNQQIFGQTYALESRYLIDGDLHIFEYLLEYFGERKVSFHRKVGLGKLLTTTGEDTAEFSQKTSSKEGLTNFVNTAVEINGETLKKLRTYWELTQSNNIFKQISSVIKSKSIKTTLGL